MKTGFTILDTDYHLIDAIENVLMARDHLKDILFYDFLEEAKEIPEPFNEWVNKLNKIYDDLVSVQNDPKYQEFLKQEQNEYDYSSSDG